MILLPNQLFFAEVETMLAEGREVQIRMKGHSMRPLLRSERDIAVLTPIARYTGNSETAAAARKQNRLARNETAPDTAANSHPTVFPPEVRPCNRATWCCSAAKDAISSTAFSASNRRAGRCPRNRQTRR